MSEQKDQMKLIKIEDIPQKERRVTVRWINILREIPEGQALVIEQVNPFDIKPCSVRPIIRRTLAREPSLKNYRVFQLLVKGKLVVYILHGKEA